MGRRAEYTLYQRYTDGKLTYTYVYSKKRNQFKLTKLLHKHFSKDAI